ncbi:GNAT family N-acetyltransferase [Streptomyces sodiiphilus]|uniref:GNAT family N-acetyltransferase n=1 Tax=Streptomyces sodiiphilus TaxID=226217 RepID=A0ABN2PI65_9ACTN
MDEITVLSGDRVRDAAPELAGLLVDAVDDGASVGFLAPLPAADAAGWWRDLAPAVDGGRVTVWAARRAGRLTGTVQLHRTAAANGRHRGEIAKLIVHRSARGRGLGGALLAAAEREAARAGMSLLILDTQTGSAAESLYRGKGWTPVGVVPGYAADPAGEPRSTTFFHKRLLPPASPAAPA